MELVGRMMDGSIPYDPKETRPGFLRLRVGQDQKMARLQEVSLFEGCSRRQLREIARISEVMEAPADTVLTRVGEPGDQFFLILDGTARVEVSERKQVKLGPGEFFGEMSLLDGEPRSATVVAETPLRLLVITRRNFLTLLGEAPELSRAILATLCKRLRQAERALKS